MITFSCECGKRYQLKDELAGKRAKCSCGKTLMIPQPVPTTQDNSAPAAARSEQPAPLVETRSRTRPRSTSWALIGGAAAVLLIVATLGIWLLTGAGAPAPNGTQPVQVARAQPEEPKELDRRKNHESDQVKREASSSAKPDDELAARPAKDFE